MGNIFPCLFPKKRIVILIIGLDNSGKTTTAARLLNKGNVEITCTTTGYNFHKVPNKNNNVMLYDLGGGASFRDLWSEYYGDCHGVIFTVDSADHTRIEESRMMLEIVLSNNLVKGKPFLLILNKQDLKDAMEEDSIIDYLGLETLVNSYKTPTRVECCGGNFKTDLSLQSGFRWLIKEIVFHYEALTLRITNYGEKQRISSQDGTTSSNFNLTKESSDSVSVPKNRPSEPIFISATSTPIMQNHSEFFTGSLSMSPSIIESDSGKSFLQQPMTSRGKVTLPPLSSPPVFQCEIESKPVPAWTSPQSNRNKSIEISDSYYTPSPTKPTSNFRLRSQKNKVSPAEDH